MQQMRDLYTKFRAGQGLTDSELNYMLDKLEKLEVELREYPVDFKLFWLEIHRTVLALRDFKHARFAAHKIADRTMLVYNRDRAVTDDTKDATH